MKYINGPVSKLIESDSTIEVHYDSNLNQFPSVDKKSATPSLDLEVVLAPLKTLEVCQLFQKILYI
jgi:hypothetical protein